MPDFTSTSPRLSGRRRGRPRGGKRRAVRPRSRRRLPGVASVQALAGLVVLAAAGAGAVTGDLPLSSAATPTTAAHRHAAHIGALAGSSRVSTTARLDRRDVIVSRDSAGDALEDASAKKVIKAAEAQAKERNAALAQFARKTEQQAQKIALNRWVLPLDHYRITATFGQSSGLWSRTHTGLDFAAPSGTPIHAVANGVITSTGYEGSYGNQTVQTLEDGTELWYCHQTSFAVSPGQQVVAGDVIGYVGSTGNSTGSHLHLEVRPGAGDPVDPYTALTARGLRP